MRNVLLAIFVMLILGFGIIGITRTISDASDAVGKNNNETVTIQ
ncbi:hypothetical protein [Lentibacillus halophilus]